MICESNFIYNFAFQVTFTSKITVHELRISVLLYAYPPLPYILMTPTMDLLLCEHCHANCPRSN